VTKVSARTAYTIEIEEVAFPLRAHQLQIRERAWAILHTHAVLSQAQEDRFVFKYKHRVPYGLALWPSSIALAHEVAARPRGFGRRRVLELGAGTGLPGLVAASLGAQVAQTDNDELTLANCRRNAEHNGVQGVEYRLVDWAAWTDDQTYDWIIGSDLLYDDEMYPHLRQIFERNLAPGGRALLADPFRKPSRRFFELLESGGWTIAQGIASVGDEEEPRPIGLFELAPPPSAR
jgi:predicted nicotinamide N-methyase